MECQSGFQPVPANYGASALPPRTQTCPCPSFRSRLESSMQHLVNRLLYVLVCSAVILFVLVISCSRLLEGWAVVIILLFFLPAEASCLWRRYVWSWHTRSNTPRMCFFSEAIMSVPASTGEDAWLLAPHHLPPWAACLLIPRPNNECPGNETGSLAAENDHNV